MTSSTALLALNVLSLRGGTLGEDISEAFVWYLKKQFFLRILQATSVLQVIILHLNHQRIRESE